MKKALIAMSGGVDSSVCAYLAIKAGYECIGATMRLCEKDFASSDADDAAKICKMLSIEHRVFDYSQKFNECVIHPFIKSYECGETPNPCVLCNKHLKFGALFCEAQKLGCDTIVTGHYARIITENGEAVLKKAIDVSKDQSYVLYVLEREYLPHIYLPLGDYTKDQVRQIALREGFVTAHKSDSQDICFVPDGDYAHFIEQNLKKESKKGNFVDEGGNVLGEHRGIIHYTVGQRKGLGLSLKEPMYVKEKNVDTGDVVLCTNDKLFSSSLVAGEFNWLIDVPDGEIHARAKIRYNQAEQDALLYPLSGGKVKFVFDKPQRAIAKGQAVVAYAGDRVIGGGTILCPEN